MLRVFMKLRTLAIGVSLVAGFTAASCSGDSEESKPPPPKTDAGELQPISCGSNTCEGVEVPFGGYPPLEPCCAADDACGLDSTFLASFNITFSEACQAKNQPGILGQGCPDSATPMIPGFTVELPPFPGCCRLDTHTCGYQLDSLVATLVKVDLGCVDSAPFLDGGMPAECDPEGTAGAGP